MAPINTHGSGIRTITNVNGSFVDNDEYVSQRSHAEHTAQATSDNPWSQSFKPREVPWEDTAPAVKPDEELTKANKRDLFIRSITPSTTESK